MQRMINEKGIDLIKLYEGFELKAYKCPAGKWTIGIGHTRNVLPGMVITKEQAYQFLQEDLQDAARAVQVSITNKLNDNQFAALVSLAFNIGAAAFRKSTLVKKLNQGATFSEIEFHWKRFKMARVGGKMIELAGLVKRRQSELELFFQ